MTGEGGVSLTDADTEIAKRVQEVGAHLRQLQDKYKDIETLLSCCGLPEVKAWLAGSNGEETVPGVDTRRRKRKSSQRYLTSSPPSKRR